mmetsp:Transcript_10539/g.16129  ORF Transcript_10539/g.16129 Transcript_10539/m.16129 type:complete len:88 (-) Transcript_10539:1496-1759(-)
MVSGGSDIKVMHEPRRFASAIGSTKELHKLGTSTSHKLHFKREASEQKFDFANSSARADHYDREKDKLFDKAFEPYYITNTTIYFFK